MCIKYTYDFLNTCMCEYLIRTYTKKWMYKEDIYVYLTCTCICTYMCVCILNIHTYLYLHMNTDVRRTYVYTKYIYVFYVYMCVYISNTYIQKYIHTNPDVQRIYVYISYIYTNMYLYIHVYILGLSNYLRGLCVRHSIWIFTCIYKWIYIY